MTPALRSTCRQLCAAHRRGGKVVLLFDYDGTLVPIVEHPRLAVLPEDIRRTLRQLAGAPRVHVGIVSGRHLADLKTVADVDGLYLVGSSGLELDFCGIQVRHPAVERVAPELSRLGGILATVLRDFPGTWLESKPIGLTVHFRRLAPEHSDELRDRVLRIVTTFRERMRLVESALSLEITPNLGWDKGTAVRMILNSISGDDISILYTGDSANDRDAMKVVAGFGGTTVGIGGEAPATAHVHISNPTEVSVLLTEFWDSVSFERLATADELRHDVVQLNAISTMMRSLPPI